MEMRKLNLLFLKNEKHYVAVDFGSLKIISEPMTLSLINEKTNTASVVKQYEDEIEKTVTNESHIGRDVAGIGVDVGIGVFCEVEIAKKLFEMQKEVLNSKNESDYDRKREKILDYIKNNISDKIISDTVLIESHSNLLGIYEEDYNKNSIRNYFIRNIIFYII